MPRRAKRRDRLVALEREFADMLKAELGDVAAGFKTLLFISQYFNPVSLPSSALLPIANELVERAQHILKLRTELGDPLEDCVAHIFLLAIRTHTDPANPHRLGPRRLAQRLLDEFAQP